MFDFGLGGTAYGATMMWYEYFHPSAVFPDDSATIRSWRVADTSSTA